ncbi:MAG: hypothetical protein N4A40_03565 [Tissierellales bacterium]|jgi:nicotinamide mononucleotide adenylyltransferase|nr:hypothetical protein [Tissierellales bacterium]
MNEIGVVCGRFQVLHNEHMDYILGAKAECKKIIVGIASPDKLRSPEEKTDLNRSKLAANPCNYFERMNMIELALRNNGLTDEEYSVVPFPIGVPDLILNYTPEDAVYYFTIYDEWGKEKVKRVGGLGLKTKVLWDDRVKGVSSSKIRELIFDNSDWKHLVPESTYEYIVNQNIDKRIVELMNRI